MCVHSHTEPPCWLLRVLLHVLGGGEREKGGREGEGLKVLAGIDGEVAFLSRLVSPPDGASASSSATRDSGGGAKVVSLDVTGGQV